MIVDWLCGVVIMIIIIVMSEAWPGACGWPNLSWRFRLTVFREGQCMSDTCSSKTRGFKFGFGYDSVNGTFCPYTFEF